MKKVTITNPDKIIYKDDKISKIDIINYYVKVAESMLPFAKNRLLSVIRCHNDIDDKFYKKHPTNEPNIASFSKNGEDFFCIKKEIDIITQVQMGTIEFHINGSNINNIGKPNLMVFDLDPDEKLSIKQLQQGVLDLKQILDELKLKSFLKTSGGKGYHIVVPFKKSKDWKSFENFSKQVAEYLESLYPKKYTTNIRKADRKGKIFIDYLRNQESATCVAPYSLRARKGVGISMPIDYKELFDVAPNEITIFNVNKRLNKKSPWKDFFNIEQSIK